MGILTREEEIIPRVCSGMFQLFNDFRCYRYFERLLITDNDEYSKFSLLCLIQTGWTQNNRTH
jgi:hypothetical protein